MPEPSLLALLLPIALTLAGKKISLLKRFEPPARRGEFLSGFRAGGYYSKMNSATDQQLLRAYAESRSETAFSELVQRYVDFVYSTALRLSRDAHMAEDVSQSVFVALAQNASELVSRPVLAGWLHGTTQNLTANAIRSEVRRRAREAIAMKELSCQEDGIDWEQIAPYLDSALSELQEGERDAVLLRYFQQRSAKEIAVALGISDEAAQKRVSRAVEKLREIFSRRGLAIGSGSLAGLMAANGIQAAPAALSMAIGAALAASTAGAATSTTMITQAAMTFMKIKTLTAIVGAALIAATGTYLLLQREISGLRGENQRLAVERDSLAGERDSSLAAAKAQEDSLKRLQTDQGELLRLRGEVNRLRQAQVAKGSGTQRPTIPQTPKATAHPPGVYITKESLTPVGYATPEAALETFTWALMMGTYEQANEGLGQEQLASELNDPNGKEKFETGRDKAASLFKGLQILARKQIDEDRVELKVKYDSEENMKKEAPKLADYSIQRMTRVGEQWKLGGSTRNYTPEWDTNGVVQTFAP